MSKKWAKKDGGSGEFDFSGLQYGAVGQSEKSYYSDYAKVKAGQIRQFLEQVECFNDTDYGHPNCPRAIIWTTDRVFFTTQYDGQTGLACVPRDPKLVEPIMS